MGSGDLCRIPSPPSMVSPGSSLSSSWLCHRQEQPHWDLCVFTTLLPPFFLRNGADPNAKPSATVGSGFVSLFLYNLLNKFFNL